MCVPCLFYITHTYAHIHLKPPCLMETRYCLPSSSARERQRPIKTYCPSNVDDQLLLFIRYLLTRIVLCCMYTTVLYYMIQYHAGNHMCIRVHTPIQFHIH